MRSLVVSDLHSNAEALKAVINRVRRKKFHRVICLGDFVGYGAQPNQVLDTMRKIRAKKLYLRGNHDRVATGLDEGGGFNPAAREAAVWTREHLSAPNRRFLAGLTIGPVKHDGFLLCHGSPVHEDEYVFTEWHAAQIFLESEAPVILYGHTHLPVIFSLDRSGVVDGELVRGPSTFRLDPARRYLINPGSVGQPRDRNPAAGYALFDDERAEITFFRVPYDHVAAAGKIRAARLPESLAYRVEIGI